MACFDVFNGDGDGICALQQLRLVEPLESTLITGVKRDIALVKQVKAAAGDQVTVLDVSFDKNRDGVEALLAAGASVRYFDHHFAGDVPQHAKLEVHIDPKPDTCTSLIVNNYLQGKHAAWAVVGAFADNFDESARKAARDLDFGESDLLELRELGICINYNGYGPTLDDLHFEPADLFRSLHPFANPLDFMAESDAFFRLKQGYDEDMRRADGLLPEEVDENIALYVLPDASWARRVSGVFANDLATDNPSRAHALLTRTADGSFLVSVRAPMNKREGADELCMKFPTGGGRKAAAGINNLPEGMFDEFVAAFKAQYPG